MKLKGKKIAVLLAPRGTEDSEFSRPKEAAEQEGAIVTVVGIEAGTARTVTSDLDPAYEYNVDRAFEDILATEFDGLIVPGGTVGSDKLRAEANAVDFVRNFIETGNPVAVICHGPWILIEAGAAKGRRLTSYPSLKSDLLNAEATWVDEQVVVDGNIITSRTPNDLPAFIDRFISKVSGQDI